MFDVKISFYPILIVISLIANIFVVMQISKKYNYSKKEIMCLLIYENAGIITGAKILSFIQHYKELNGEFNFIRLGFSSYGGVIGALLFIALFSFQFKKSLKELLCIFLPSFPIMYSIGKIGCFLSGCCYGIEYNGLGNIVYYYSTEAPSNVHLFPIQIVETITFFAIFIYIIIKHKQNKFDLKTLGISFILCGGSKFCLDFLRASHVGKVISLNQIMSLLFIIIGLTIITLYNKNQKNQKV